MKDLTLAEVQELLKGKRDTTYQFYEKKGKIEVAEKFRGTHPDYITVDKEGGDIWTMSGKCNPPVFTPEW